MRWLICVLLLGLVVGCGSGAPRIDGSSPAAFAASWKEMTKSLSPAELKEFELASELVTLDAYIKSGAPEFDSSDDIHAFSHKALHGMTASQIQAAAKATTNMSPPSKFP